MPTEIRAEFMPGDDGDCELCGYSYNELRWTYNYVLKQHEISTSIGCYGGSTEETKEDAVAVLQLTALADAWPTADEGIADLAAWIKSWYDDGTD